MSDTKKYDFGLVVDGKVVYKEDTKEYVVVDEHDNITYSVQDILKSNVGKTVRLTCISMESLDEIEKLMKEIG